MTGHRRGSLPLLLMTRLLKEEAAERALSCVAEQACVAEVKAAQLRAQHKRFAEARNLTGGSLQTGADVRSEDAHRSELRVRCLAANSELQRLKALQLAQMNTYREARSEREMIADLIDRRRTVHEAALNRSEQKGMDDLFAARAVRKRDKGLEREAHADQEARWMEQ